MCYEITLEKCICAGRTIVHTIPPRDKKIMIFCKHEHLGEVMVVNDPFLARMHYKGLMIVMYIFQTFNFVLIVAVYHIYPLYLKPSKVEAGKSIT